MTMSQQRLRPERVVDERRLLPWSRSGGGEAKVRAGLQGGGGQMNLSVDGNGLDRAPLRRMMMVMGDRWDGCQAQLAAHETCTAMKQLFRALCAAGDDFGEL